MRRSSVGIWLLLVLVLTTTVWWSYAQGTIQVGYTVVTRNTGTEMPVGTAVFSFRNGDGVLVTEAGVGGVEPVMRGRVFVDEVGTRTGVALVNPESASQVVNLTLRDGAGTVVGEASLVMNPGQHLARFVDELFGTAPGFEGSLTFETGAGLGAITLRQSMNGFGEPLFTTLPVVDLDAAAGTEAVVFPHLAAGGGFQTQVILINPSGESISGQIRLIQSDGTRLEVDWDGVTVSENTYQIEPNGVSRVRLTRSGDVAVGYVVLTPEVGGTPSGSVVFQFLDPLTGTQLVTEAGVGVTAETTTARISVDNVGRQTGVAIANRGSGSADVLFILQDQYGVEQDRVTQTVPAGGHLARMAQELFPMLELGFSGLIEIQSPIPIAPITLQLTVNTRGELVMTTLPVADLTRPETASMLVFPHVVIGSGFETRLVFMNGEAASVGLEFYASDGTAMTVPLGTQTSNQFMFDFAANEGRRLFPGDTATVSSVSLRDPVTNALTTEVTINEGNTVRPRILAIDSTGKARDDLGFTLTSLDTTVATTNDGQITGNQQGFSTLTIQSGDVVATATITVVEIESGVAGAFGIGIAEDLAGRVYLASTQDHTVVRAESLSQTPEVYAGQRQRSGLRNDLRLESEFASPAFLSLDQARGDLYVSDAANHVIRIVAPGPNGRAETLAGTGTLGSADGISTQAGFNNPQGVALDHRGHLWVADKDNHTIRRINLITGEVETIAGLAGQAGFADGQGDTARFNQPTGIAVETETLAHQLAREARGDPPQPFRVIVADTGNNVIRRVTENGQVETLRQQAAVSGLSVGPNARFTQHASPPITFDTPTGVSANRFGDIYVVVLGPNGIQVILRNGDLVPASQGNTFGGATSVVADRRGGVLVAGGNGVLLATEYGAPLITSITPEQVDGRGGELVTIRGANFTPESVIIIGSTAVPATVHDTQTITFTSPEEASGRTTLTVQTRAGLAQSDLLLAPIPLNQLSLGEITTIAGGSPFAGDGSAAADAVLYHPEGMAFDSQGHLYVADKLDHRVRKIDLRTGIILTVAGTGQLGFSGDGGPAVAAALFQPRGVAIDPSGNLLIADSVNRRIRKVDLSTGIIQTVAGSNNFGFSGDGGLAINAELWGPAGVTVDRDGDIYIADTRNNRVRKVDATTGIITTVAGNGTADFSGDGGRATDASLNRPLAVALDRDGNLLISDSANYRVRQVDGSGVISTVLGTGEWGGYDVPEGPATEVPVKEVFGLAVSGEGDLFIADPGNGRVIRVLAGNATTVWGGTSRRGLAIDAGGNLFASTGPLNASEPESSRVLRMDSRTESTKIAGGGLPLGDGGPAWAARLYSPRAIDVAPDGSLLIVDRMASRVRRVDGSTGLISTVAGRSALGATPSGLPDNVPGTDFSLTFPEGVTTDDDGNVFIADGNAGEIHRIDANTGILTRVPGLLRDLWTSVWLVGVAVDSTGNLYFTDARSNQLFKLDPNGTLGEVLDSGGNPIVGKPWGLDMDRPNNQLFVTDEQNNTVVKFDLSTLVATRVAGGGSLWGAAGDGGPAVQARLNAPFDVTVDGQGNLFVAENVGYRVRRVDSQTGIITTVAGNGSRGFSGAGDGGPATEASFGLIMGVALDASGNLFISGSTNNRIRVVKGPLN